MKTGRWAALGGLIGTAALLLAACGGTTSTSSQQAPLQKANEMVAALPPQVGITNFAPVANALTLSVYNGGVNYMMYAPLVMVSSQDNIDQADSLAQSITPNSNDTAFTVKLKNWNFSNGTPITAQDIAFDANLLMQACTMKNSPYSYGDCGFGGIPPVTGRAELTSVTADNANTVTFKLSQPANPVWFELNGLGQILAFPKAQWDKGSYMQDLQFLKSVASTPNASVYKVVSGPYKFSDMVTNQYWKFVPNTKYGGPAATVTVVLQYEASGAAEFAALRTNKINQGYLQPTEFGAAKQLKGYNQGLVSAFSWNGIQINSFKNQYVGNAFNDPAVRAALQYGIDEDAIGKLLFGTLNGKNLWVDQYSAIPTNFPALTKNVFGTSHIPVPYPYNPAQGMKVLENDGYHMVNGVMTKGSTKLEFPVLYSSGSQSATDAALVLKQDYAKEGIIVTLTSVPFDTQIAMNNTQTPSNAPKWAFNWYGGWGYEPNYYPTGGGMWGYYQTVDSYSYAPFYKAVNNEYLPGSAAQAQKNMYAYAMATAKDLPVLWTPNGYGVSEAAPYLHGSNKWWNPVEYFTLWNHLTISH